MAVATYECATVMTSSPGPIPKARIAKRESGGSGANSDDVLDPQRAGEPTFEVLYLGAVDEVTMAQDPIDGLEDLRPERGVLFDEIDVGHRGHEACFATFLQTSGCSFIQATFL